jgi:hypothetical protein
MRWNSHAIKFFNLVLLGTLLPAVNHAAVNTANGLATPGAIPLQDSITLNLRWTVGVSYNAPPNVNPVTIGANALDIGTLQGNTCTPLQTHSQPITTQLTVNPPLVTTITFNETLSLPPAIAMAARQLGANAICVRRTFGDDASVVTATATIGLPIQSGGIGSATFSLNHIQLRFDDEALSRIVTRGASLQARARVRYQGRGLLRVAWEVADPTSTLGTPVYRILHTIHRQLTGNGEAILESPPLPTLQPGLHLLRLRVIQPDIGQHRLILRYYVQGQRLQSQVPELFLLSPESGQRLGPDTRFRWKPVANAVAYGIELTAAKSGFEAPADDLPDDDEQSTTGMLVPADQAEVSLSALVRNHLDERAWYWRVVAYGEQGRILARSQWRRLLR